MRLGPDAYQAGPHQLCEVHLQRRSCNPSSVQVLAGIAANANSLREARRGEFPSGHVPGLADQEGQEHLASCSWRRQGHSGRCYRAVPREHAEADGACPHSDSRLHTLNPKPYIDPKLEISIAMSLSDPLIAGESSSTTRLLLPCGRR